MKSTLDQQKKIIQKIQSYILSGSFDFARTQIRKAEKIGVSPFYLSYLQGSLEERQGDVGQATTFYETALAHESRDKIVLKEIGNFFVRHRDMQNAANAFASAYRLDNRDIDILSNLANCYFFLSQYSQAEPFYLRVIELDPSRWSARANLAQLYFTMGRYREAIPVLSALLETHPKHHDAYITLALSYEQTNNLIEAEKIIRQAEQAIGSSGVMRVVEMKLLRRREGYEKAYHILSTLDVSALPLDSRIMFFNESGFVLEQMGLYERAFEAFKTAKAYLKQKRQDHRPFAQFDQEFTGIENFYSRLKKSLAAAESGRQISSQDNTPIFIVGPFRCGSTLLERILIRHHSVTTVGELSQFSYQASHIVDAYTDNLEAFVANIDTITANFCKEYLSVALKTSGNNAPWIVDKFLFNALHAPLMNVMFRNAPIVFMFRHPADIIVSSFQHLFKHSTPWAYEIRDIALFVARIFEHMLFLRDDIGLSNLYLVRYEDLVVKPDETTRPLLKHLGLAWNDGMLKFFENDSVVQTASYYQVNKPLYQTSLNKYKHYWRCFDDETKQIISKIAIKMGYEIDDTNY